MEEAEDEITLQEALETQEILEKQSMAVLGASDPQNCSYSKGYMKRQALYACLTCNPKGAPFSQPAGVCLACSYNCHEGHELVELFTKRHFRCDCGNKKFPDNKCKLQAEKDAMNVENKYNQNFNGLYCSCHKPYPNNDPNDEVADDPMIQCIICEDWFHFTHCLSYLNMEFENLEGDDSELICGPCMGRLDFLSHYSDFTLKPQKEAESGEAPGSSENSEGTKGVAADESVPPKNEEDEKTSKPSIPDESNLAHPTTSTEKEQTKDPTVVVVDNCSRDSGIDSLPGSEGSSGTEKCLLKTHVKESLPHSDIHGVAWKASFRSSLCRCSDCMAMYENLNIQFLLDEEDTIEHYEAIGQKLTEAAKESAEASISNQMNRLGRVGQIELLHGYNEFKEQLADFLKSHAENGKVVQREDVNKFFARMNEEQAAKRRRLE